MQAVDVRLHDRTADPDVDVLPAQKMIEYAHGTGEVAGDAAHQVVCPVDTVQRHHDIERDAAHGEARRQGVDAFDGPIGVQRVGDERYLLQSRCGLGDSLAEVRKIGPQGRFAAVESDGLDALEQGVGEYPAGFGHGHLLVDLSLPDVAHLAFGVADVVDRELHDDRKLHRPRTIHAGVTQRLPGIRQRAQSWKLPGVHHAR